MIYFMKRAWQFFFPLRDKEGNVHPVGHPYDRSDLIWALIDKEWRPVCSLCYGNCGQCGLTDKVGNIPASLESIVENTNMNSGQHAGLPLG